MYHTVPPKQDKYCVNALSRKSSKSLAYIREIRRPLIMELHGLMDEGVRFNLNKARVMIAHYYFKSDLFDKIKVTHKRVDSLLRIKDKVEQGTVIGFVIGKDNVLSYGNRLCVPDVDDMR